MGMWVAIKLTADEPSISYIHQKIPPNATQGNGGAGIIQIPNVDEVIVLVCNSKTSQYIGLIPNNQQQFIATLKKVFAERQYVEQQQRASAQLSQQVSHPKQET